MDEMGGDNFQILGTSQFLSVPYAMHAGTVDNVNDADSDPMNEIQNVTVDTIDLSPLQVFNQIFLDSIMLILSESNDTLLLYDSNPVNEFQQLVIVDTTASVASDEGYAELDLIPSISSPIVVDASPTNELQILKKTALDSILGRVSKVELINEDLSVASTIVIDDTDFKNELQRIKPLNIGNNFYIVLEEKRKNEIGGNDWIPTDTICIPDSDTSNEIQLLDNVIHTNECSDKFELRIGHNEVDSNGVLTWVVDDSEFIPDSDPINELQRLEIEPHQISNSILRILRKECVPDSLEPDIERTVWIPFDSVYIEDTDPTNELQTLDFNLFTDELTISGGNTVDISSLLIELWIENITTKTAEYDGTAKAEGFCTKEGGVTIDDTGVSRFNTSNGNNVSNLCLEEVGNTTWGKLEILNNNDLVSNLQSCIHRSGILDIHGPNGNFNVEIGHEFGLPNHGMIGIYDSANTQRTGMFVNNLGQGVLFADVKNFKMNHPVIPDKEIWYASLEGPEVGAYERGTSQLTDGTVFVAFSDHFKEVINPESMTVMLTPLSAETYGLAVVEKNADGFRVKELMRGEGNFEFDWEVKSVRRSYEDYEVVRDKRGHQLNYHNPTSQK